MSCKKPFGPRQILWTRTFLLLSHRLAMQLKKHVAVVVTIYNAHSAVSRLLRSLSKTTQNAGKLRFIFVDDASTDPEITRSLKLFCKERRNSCVIRHNKNRGYTKSVLAGIKRAPRKWDVLLLNSDTVVFENWLEELQNCAYEDRRIASVNPLTNNCLYASVVNWPNGGRMSLQQASQVARALRRENGSKSSYPVLSTFGFCMYLKRSAFQRLNSFDLKLFPRGYGEEVDWCFKSQKMGYTHRLCSTAFVFHKGGASFSKKERKRNLIQSTRLLAFHFPNEFRDYNLQFKKKSFRKWISQVQKKLGAPFETQ